MFRFMWFGQNKETMSTLLQILSTPSEDRTFPLIVEDQKLWVSKEVLSMCSPVFRNMFYGGFKETVQNSVTLSGKRLKDVLELLSCLFYSRAEKRWRKQCENFTSICWRVPNWKSKTTLRFFHDKKVENRIGFRNDENFRHVGAIRVQWRHKKLHTVCGGWFHCRKYFAKENRMAALRHRRFNGSKIMSIRKRTTLLCLRRGLAKNIHVTRAKNRIDSMQEMSVLVLRRMFSWKPLLFFS